MAEILLFGTLSHNSILIEGNFMHTCRSKRPQPPPKFAFFRDNNVVSAFQLGFVPGDSTVNQLNEIYNTFCKALDEGKEVRAIVCDISKAFDRVWHKGLLFKLKSAGVSGSLLTWFSNYLNGRKQRVVLTGVSCSWTSVKAGVPQGSILGSLLFLLHINDIVEDINSSMILACIS